MSTIISDDEAAILEKSEYFKVLKEISLQQNNLAKSHTPDKIVIQL